MTTPEPADPLQHRCPTCYAPPGALCFWKGTTPIGPHAARIRAAKH